MKRFLIISGVVCLFSVAAIAAELSMLARVTVYWASGGSGSDKWTRNHQAATKVRLREGHCAVDPKRIPYGSKVILPDGTLTAVDTGGQVKSRRAARRAGRSAEQRSAIVVDRFFETKREALAWAKRNPRFMKVRVVSTSRIKDLTTGAETRRTETTTATKLAASKPAPPPILATKTVRQVAVAPSPAPGIVSVAKNDAAAPRPVALRTSVPTARDAASARPQPIVASAALGSSGANPLPRAAAPRLATNTAPQPPPVANAAPAIMVHGPSHYDRRVSYMP
jgi:hypothetical protein